MSRLLSLSSRQHIFALVASVAFIVAALCAIFALLRPPTIMAPTVPPRNIPVVRVPGVVSLEGEYTCLPHRDTSGPQTLECALGLKTDRGDHYALDFGRLGTQPPPFATGERFSATGLLTPIEYLSSDQWRKYDVKGIFSVTGDIVRK